MHILLEIFRGMMIQVHSLLVTLRSVLQPAIPLVKLLMMVFIKMVILFLAHLVVAFFVATAANL